MTRREIIEMIEDEDIKFIRLQFTDLDGSLKNIATTVSQIERVLDGLCKFSCSTVDGFKGCGYDELFLMPDLDTFVIFPWRPQHGKVARFICDLKKPDGTPFESDPRNILKSVLKEATDEGYIFEAAAKNEFFLFEEDDEGRPTNHSSDRGGYFDVGPLDGGENARRDMVIYLQDMDIQTDSSYHANEESQHVLELSYSDVLKLADNIQTLRFTVRTVAKRHGMHASFMPKPDHSLKGSGTHIKMIANRDGENAFSDENGMHGISKTCYSFTSGILAHIDSMSVITNPIVNSYKRLVPGYLAPINIGWSLATESPLIRLTAIGQSGAKVVLRNPDGAANPYLMLALIIASGLEGIRNNYDIDKNMDEMNEDEILTLKALPRHLFEAVEAFNKDEFIKQCLGKNASEYIIKTKNKEWSEYYRHVSNWELDKYLPYI